MLVSITTRLWLVVKLVDDEGLAPLPHAVPFWSESSYTTRCWSSRPASCPSFRR